MERSIQWPLMFVAVYLLTGTFCETEVPDGKLRDPKFSIFQIIKFQNGPCRGGTTNRNGTCFTAAECENQGGTKGGDCADGFGVCCITMLAAGATTSLNQSYIVRGSSDSTALETGNHEYTICPCSTDVCRIRFDFTDFMIAGPYSSAGSNSAAALAANNVEGDSVGDCLTDTFSITGVSPTGGTPIICGMNTGQHVIVDSDGSTCHKVSLGIGQGTTMRSLDIMVTQYRCGEEIAGPPGCLQYHTEPAGMIRSFNFPNQAPAANVAGSVTHLSNQKYQICIRQPAGTNWICYVPCTSVAGAENGNTVTAQSSFGLSISPDAAASKSGVDAACDSDYITIPGGISDVNAMLATPPSAPTATRLCGREFNSATAQAFAANTKVCSTTMPYTVGVNFDANEVDANKANAMGHELAKAPGGIIGFSLCYTTST